MPNDHPHAQEPNYIGVIRTIAIFAQEHADSFYKWVNNLPDSEGREITRGECSVLLADARDFMETVSLVTELNLTETASSAN